MSEEKCPFCKCTAGTRRRRVDELAYSVGDDTMTVYKNHYPCGVRVERGEARGQQERTRDCYEREIAALNAERDKALADYFEMEKRLETYFEERPIKLGVRVCGYDIYIDHTAPPDIRRKAFGDLVEGGVCRDRHHAKEGEGDE